MSNKTPKMQERNGRSIHFSAGAVIRRGDKLLLIDRVKPPFGMAGLAGHVDEGETPTQAVIREVSEESGLKVTSTKLLFEEFVDWNECSKGITGHHWYVFECETNEEVKANRAEAKSFGWYDVEQLRDLELEPVWEYWFEKLELL
jgi:8-oxo-dGTP pyrophosphatase MutT (NUDIX family)